MYDKDPQQQTERRQYGDIGLKIGMLHDDVMEMKGAIKDLAKAINRLAVVEERQVQATAALERAFDSIGKINDRINALEQKAIITGQTSMWVERGVWAAAAAAAVFIAQKTGLLK